jgi:hypothetical protein
MRSHGEEIRRWADSGKLGVAEHFDRYQTRQCTQIQLHGLNRAGQVCHAENHVVLVSPDVGQHFSVRRMKEFDRPSPENFEQLSQPDHVLHPVEQRRTVALLGFDIDSLIPVNRVHDDRTVETRGIGA